MEKIAKGTQKATLIAAALIITGTTAIFGTYAATSEETPPYRPAPFACLEMVSNLTEEQKTKMQEAHELMRNGDTAAAKAIFDELGLERPERKAGKGFGDKRERMFQMKAGWTK